MKTYKQNPSIRWGFACERGKSGYPPAEGRFAGRSGHSGAVSPVGTDPATRLKQLESLKSQGLITEAEYAEKRGGILAEL